MLGSCASVAPTVNKTRREARPRVISTYVEAHHYGKYYYSKLEARGGFVYRYGENERLLVRLNIPGIIGDPELNGLNIKSIIKGNPSVMFVGTDAMGNYDLILQTEVIGGYLISVKTEFSARKLSAIGIRFVVWFDDKTKTFIAECTDIETKRCVGVLWIKENGEAKSSKGWNRLKTLLDKRSV